MCLYNACAYVQRKNYAYIQKVMHEKQNFLKMISWNLTHFQIVFSFPRQRPLDALNLEFGHS